MHLVSPYTHTIVPCCQSSTSWANENSWLLPTPEFPALNFAKCKLCGWVGRLPCNDSQLPCGVPDPNPSFVQLPTLLNNSLR